MALQQISVDQIKEDVVTSENAEQKLAPSADEGNQFDYSQNDQKPFVPAASKQDGIDLLLEFWAEQTDDDRTHVYAEMRGNRASSHYLYIVTEVQQPDFSYLLHINKIEGIYNTQKVNTVYDGYSTGHFVYAFISTQPNVLVDGSNIDYSKIIAKTHYVFRNWNRAARNVITEFYCFQTQAPDPANNITGLTRAYATLHRDTTQTHWLYYVSNTGGADTITKTAGIFDTMHSLTLYQVRNVRDFVRAFISTQGDIAADGSNVEYDRVLEEVEVIFGGGGGGAAPSSGYTVQDFLNNYSPNSNVTAGKDGQGSLVLRAPTYTLDGTKVLAILNNSEGNVAGHLDGQGNLILQANGVGYTVDEFLNKFSSESNVAAEKDESGNLKLTAQAGAGTVKSATYSDDSARKFYPDANGNMPLPIAKVPSFVIPLANYTEYTYFRQIWFGNNYGASAELDGQINGGDDWVLKLYETAQGGKILDLTFGGATKEIWSEDSSGSSTYAADFSMQSGSQTISWHKNNYMLVFPENSAGITKTTLENFDAWIYEDIPSTGVFDKAAIDRIMRMLSSTGIKQIGVSMGSDITWYSADDQGKLQFPSAVPALAETNPIDTMHEGNTVNTFDFDSAGPVKDVTKACSFKVVIDPVGVYTLKFETQSGGTLELVNPSGDEYVIWSNGNWQNSFRIPGGNWSYEASKDMHSLTLDSPGEVSDFTEVDNFAGEYTEQGTPISGSIDGNQYTQLITMLMNLAASQSLNVKGAANIQFENLIDPPKVVQWSRLQEFLDGFVSEDGKTWQPPLGRYLPKPLRINLTGAPPAEAININGFSGSAIELIAPDNPGDLPMLNISNCSNIIYLENFVIINGGNWSGNRDIEVIGKSGVLTYLKNVKVYQSFVECENVFFAAPETQERQPFIIQENSNLSLLGNNRGWVDFAAGGVRISIAANYTGSVVFDRDASKQPFFIVDNREGHPLETYSRGGGTPTPPEGYQYLLVKAEE